jgi:hypothetical protein
MTDQAQFLSMREDEIYPILVRFLEGHSQALSFRASSVLYRPGQSPEVVLRLTAQGDAEEVFDIDVVEARSLGLNHLPKDHRGERAEALRIIQEAVYQLIERKRRY